MFTLNQKELKSALTNLGYCIDNKPLSPALENVMFEPVGNRIKVLATNMTVWGTILLDAVTAGEAGDLKHQSFTLPYKTLKSIVSNMSGEISFQWDEEAQTCSISDGEKRGELYGVTSEEMPPLPDIEIEPANIVARFESDELLRAIEVVSLSAAREATRPILKGIFFDGEKNAIVSADGYRLSVVKLDNVYMERSDFPQFVIPLDTVKFFSKAFSNTADEIILFAHGDLYSFIAGDVQIIFRELKGRFPDYSAIIPQSGGECEINLSEFKGAVDFVMAFAKDYSGIIRIEFGDNVATFIGKGERGVLSQTVVATGAKPMVIDINAKYVADVYKTCKSQTLVVQYKGESPVSFRYDNVTYAVMPVSS